MPPTVTPEQQLEPLPELPENSEDGFFSKEALDFQYATGPAENPPFPTWGSTSAEMAAMGTAAATNAMTPPSSTPAAGATVVSAAAPTCGNKRALPESTQGRPAGAADRTVFLRQRLGGESVSSGNSSTSTSSDNGSASDDVSGDWEGGSSGGDARRTKPFVHGPPAFPRAGGRSGGPAVATTTAAEGAGSVQAPNKAVRRMRHDRSKSKGRSRKSGSRSGNAGGKAGSGGRAGGYVSWATLVKPLKQQWDHVEAAAAVLPAAASKAAAAAPLESGGACSVFSAVPLPCDTTAFSVEQCSAQAHPTEVASYVLRVRCGAGAHIVRRTWDDIVSLCTLLRRDLALPATNATDTITGIDGGVSGGTRAATAAAAAATASTGVEFAPADVVARDAASGFLKDMLARPGMAWAMPARRFLELEYLDGTLRGGAADDGREKTARQVAAMAAAASTVSAAVPQVAAASDAQLASGVESAAGGSVAAPANGIRFEASRSSVGAPRAALSLPAHPDAARDLAAVCRCLGELGAAAFTTLPRVGGAAPYWAARDDDGAAGRVGGVVAQRGMPVLA